MLGLLGFGRHGESPWLWLIIIGGGVAFYGLGRLGLWPRSRARSWADVADSLFMVGVPWWQYALFLAIVGGGSTYHLATGHYRWFWWLLPAVAWFTFVVVMVRRKSPGETSNG